MAAFFTLGLQSQTTLETFFCLGAGGALVSARLCRLPEQEVHQPSKKCTNIKSSHRFHRFTQKFIAEKRLPQISQNSQKFIAEKKIPQNSQKFIVEKRLPQNSRISQKFIAEKKTPTDFTDLHRCKQIVL